MPSRPLLALLACTLAAGLAACGGSDDSGEATPPPAAATDGRTDTGCERVDRPAARSVDLPRPKTRLDPSKTYVATVSTSCGDFQITLDAERAPKTGGSFKYLADKGAYDDTTFHRIVAGFVIQGGDPKGDGTGGPGYKVVEPPPEDLRYTEGVVAMAKTQLEAAGTSGSQFFVVTAKDAKLPPEYALLGTVTGGEDVVERIAAADTDEATEEPVEPIVIRSVQVTAGG